jgi:Cof subfamily protein (haloacid dehalogenase superfamily)
VPTYRLLAIDIDGTLVNSRDELTDATREGLVRAVAAGIRVVLATGRQYSRSLPLAQALGLNTPIVTACGSLIKDPANHATLYRASFGEGVVSRLVRAIDAAGFDPVVYTDHFHDGFEYHYSRSPPRRAELAQFVELNARTGRFRPDLVANPLEGIFAGFAMGGCDEMLALSRQLDKQFDGLLSLHVLRSPRYLGHMCEIAPAGVNKWSGILRVAEMWGIAAHEICAVGDDINDIPMLRGAGLGIAMGNAAAEVLPHAQRIAPRHDDDGLVNVVEWLLDAESGIKVQTPERQ